MASDSASNGHASPRPLPSFLDKCRSMPDDEFRKYAHSRFRDVLNFEAELRDGAGDEATGPYSTWASRAVRGKDRYSDIAPYDGNRVKLQRDRTKQNMADDYINASLVKVLFGLRTFIASQGPLAHTAADFWEMVWEQNSRVIVMVTKEEENGREKVFRYWPRSGSQSHKTALGELAVRLADTTTEGDIIIRKFALTLSGGPEREVAQVQFVGWPDHGIPDSHGHMVDVLERSNTLQKGFMASGDGAGPVVVHCSAGVGRTGTIIALDTFMRLLDIDNAVATGGKPDLLTEVKSITEAPLDWNKDWIFEVVKQLRTQRTTMVQAFDQYRFLYKEVAERLLGTGARI